MTRLLVATLLLATLLLATLLLAGLPGCSSREEATPAGDSGAALSADAGAATSETATDEAPVPSNRLPVPDEADAGFDVPPTPLTQVSPEYPESARDAGVVGATHVEVAIDATGHVTNTRVAKSSENDDLDAAALAAAAQWTFTPAQLKGKPVAARIVIPFQYALN